MWTESARVPKENAPGVLEAGSWTRKGSGRDRGQKQERNRDGKTTDERERTYCHR